MPTTWTDRTKPSATAYTGRTSVSPVTEWTERISARTILLKAGGDNLLQAGGDKLLISDKVPTAYTPRTKP